MNFQKLFNDYKVDNSIKINRGWVNVKCPFCGGDSYKFGFNPQDDYCTCFACGGHNLYDALSRILNVKRNELKEILPDYEGNVTIRKELNNKIKVNKLELPSDEFTTAERKYLEKRNFNPDYLYEKYKVVGGGIAGRWKHRIIIPILLNGKVVSWTARSILSKEKLQELNIPRYMNLSVDESIVDPKHTLFNLDNCNKKAVILTEGGFDVLRFGDNAICSFGIELTETQINIIKDRFEKVFILFDNEVQAQKTARKFGIELSAIGVDVEVVDAYSDYGVNDGAELSDEQVKEIKKELGLWNTE